jgi:multidrug efflux system outer membrane protein
MRSAAGVPRPRPFALVLALALSACAVGPNYHRPDLSAPEAFRDHAAEAESIADLPWFEIFRDEALATLVRESLANNRDLAIAIARVEQSRYLAGVARGPLFPQAGYEGDAARGDRTFLGGVAPGDRTNNSFLATLNFAWEIDLWGRIRRSSEAARAELYASDAFRRGVVLSLISGVAQAYFELLELDLELEIARSSVQSYQETLDLFSRQHRGGVSSKLDPLRAEAALAQAAAGIPELERRIVAKENQISVLIGRPAGSIARGETMLAQSTPPKFRRACRRSCSNGVPTCSRRSRSS